MCKNTCKSLEILVYDAILQNWKKIYKPQTIHKNGDNSYFWPFRQILGKIMTLWTIL